MASSRFFPDGRRKGKAPEKSSFAQTCNMLSRFVKEKGGLRDLNIEIDGKIRSFDALVKPSSTVAASTMNLLTNMENSAPPSTDCFNNKVEDSLNKATKSNDEATKVEAIKSTSAAPLTIFYGGRVLVFDDYPADKAKELVSFAQIRCGISSNTLQEKPNSPRPQAGGCIKSVGISSNTCKEAPIPSISEAVASSSRSEQRLPEGNGSDMPIARRSSLHRFLEKRKDRSVARGPYQVREQPASSSKGDEQLELKL